MDPLCEGISSHRADTAAAFAQPMDVLAICLSADQDMDVLRQTVKADEGRHHGNCRFRAICDSNADPAVSEKSRPKIQQHQIHQKCLFIMKSGRPGLESPRLPLLFAWD